MGKTLRKPIGKKQSDAMPEPVWDVARLFPGQGAWSEDDYFELETNKLVELSDGSIEVLPPPTTLHQMILGHLYSLLHAFVRPGCLGQVLVAALPVRLWPGKIREPDILFMLAANAHRIGARSWDRADLVMEIVSTNRSHDFKTKRSEYARAGIPEYWIVDPEKARIVVLRLDGKKYVVHGQFRIGQRATSVLLPGFEIDVDAALASGATI